MKEMLYTVITIFITLIITMLIVFLILERGAELRHKRNVELCILEGRCKVNQEQL